ncbi:MAG: hypothetical protein E2O70_02610, partial [Candidatus Dadabacteria bacterium]
MVSGRENNNSFYFLVFPFFVFLFILLGADVGIAQLQATAVCNSQNPNIGQLSHKDDPLSLEVTGHCIVDLPGKYYFKNVNIFNGGILEFKDADIEFWAKSILVEKDSSLIAGTTADPIGPDNTITIYLYGSENDKHITCKTDDMCGAGAVWNLNSKDTINPSSCTKSMMPDDEMECFYNYTDPANPNDNFFGLKVLAVSYGGTIEMYGSKGATYTNLPSSSSGTSWVRLASNLTTDHDTLTVNRAVPDWEKEDHVVVTTTDYLPGHSEKLVITEKISDTQFKFKVLDPHTNKIISNKARFPHNGTTYKLSKVPSRVGLDIKVDGEPAVETRAAVGLLTRSIRIVSAGGRVGEEFGPPTAGNYFGGHVMARQGVKTLQIQGVEFYQLGQGGRKGRYP